MFQLKRTLIEIAKLVSGPKWSTADYRDLLCLLFLLTNTMTMKGMITLETHIEKPRDSAFFKRFPRISGDQFALNFICDTLRMMAASLEDPHQLETAMKNQLEQHHRESLAPAHALQTVADVLPALGIVAAVFGVIKTMGPIMESPEMPGAMISAALLGTFLGVFLSYGLVGPVATRLKCIVDEEAEFYRVIRDILVAHLLGNSAQASVEIGRRGVPSECQPSFDELEAALNSIPAA